MAQKWNAFQQAQILSNQRPEMSVGTMECNGIPVESEENFAHEIEQLIEKENSSAWSPPHIALVCSSYELSIMRIMRRNNHK